MSNKTQCKACNKPVPVEAITCNHCGAELRLRRPKLADPSQTLLDLNRFLIVAILFIIALVTLGLILF